MRLFAALVLLISPATASDQDPTGNWKMTIRVGHVGEGLRTVILEVTQVTDDAGGYAAQLTSMQNRMTEADEVAFEGDTLTVWYGSYEYELTIDGDSASGTVTSPAGTQEVTAIRQESQLFAGDDPDPYEKTWRGHVERQDDRFVIVTRRNTFAFVNADAFERELLELSGETVAITGFWRVDRIEIHTIEPWEGRRR